MGKNNKTVFKGFDYMHCDDFARLLMDMAAKGWHFKEWGAGLKFEKGEPEQVVYAVEVFNKASENDTRPAPETKEFAEYCEAAGWELVDSKQKFCIFKKIDENATELFTPEERVTNAFKASTLGYPIALLVLYGINAVLQWINVTSFFERYIFSPTFLFSFSIWNVMFLGQLCTFVYAFIKKRKLMKDIRDGKEIYIGSQKGNRLHFTARDIYVVILLALLSYYFLVMKQPELIILNLALIGSVLLMAILVNKFRPDRDTNVIIQGVFTMVVFLVFIVITIGIISDVGENVSQQKEEAPLLISDYRECLYEEDDIDIYHESNLFGSIDNYFIFTEEESIYYTIYKSENSRILDGIWEREFTEKKFNEGATDCTSEWGAEKALRNENGEYYVRYETSILVFRDYEDIYLAPEQIDIILTKLDLR